MKHPGEIVKKMLGSQSQVELAKELGLSKQLVSAVLRGERNITVPVAFRLAEVLGKSPGWWLRKQLDYDLEEYRQKAGIGLVE